MRPGKTALAALVSVLGLSLVACGQQPQRVSPGAEPDGPGISRGEAEQQAPTVRWADEYCLAVGKLVQSLSTMPAVDPSSTERALQTSSKLLGTMITGLDDTLLQLRRMPRSPVQAGEGVRDAAIETFSGARAKVAAARQRVDATPPGDPAAKEALSAASGPIDEVSKIGLLDGFTTVPELSTASAQAVSCQQLTNHGGPSASLSQPGTP